MTDSKKTNITIHSDKAVGLSSRMHGANVDAVAFNVDLIAQKNPTKAVEILDLYKEVKHITPETPAQPDEDFGLAADQINKTIKDLDS
jgi:hypothetical protein